MQNNTTTKPLNQNKMITVIIIIGNKMIRLLLLLPILFACKTSKENCDAYSIYQVPYNDSIFVTQWHEHVEFDNKKHCIYVPKEIVYFKDTIELRIPITYQHHPNPKK
jgi:hypothetical protein